MIILKDLLSIKNYLAQPQKRELITGFVPTMGALHQGHIDLIKQAKKNCGLVIASIFVNPTQFNNSSDFQKYPVTIEQDIYLLEKAGTDILLIPSVETLYPEGTAGLENYELGYLETVLEGFYRPDHFQGVCQVMSRLLKSIQPTRLYMGQKDYQQCMVVKKLIELISSSTKLVTCATIREEDGLAMSSRNKRLGIIAREKAIGIFRTLVFIKETITKGALDSVKKEAIKLLSSYDFKIDYIEIADADTLELIDRWNDNQKIVALIAAFQEDVRLIDNMVIAS